MPLANILFQRGIKSYAAARAFFRPDLEALSDPYLMQDMEVAVHRILDAYEQKEKVLLIGDYDVDGTSAVALCAMVFSDWGISVDYYIPDRYKEGYGISMQGIDYAHSQGASLIISLDCGIKAFEPVRYARSLGLDMIICDHHQPGDALPDALAILDPKRADCAYPFKALSGCGVGFMLLRATFKALLLAGKLDPSMDPQPKYIDLVALSVACDIVPIQGENRIIAYHGLKKLRTDPLPGLEAIMALAKGQRDWSVSDLVFFIGPRVNAAGRLGDAKDAVAVLLGDKALLAEKARQLDVVNEARKELDRQITEEALSLIEQDAHFAQKTTTVLYHPDWHKGVVGIVASRLIESHYRPTVLLAPSDDKWVGSARSIPGFDLYEALEECADCLLQFGGHTHAAGLSIAPERLTEFQVRFDEVVNRRLPEAARQPVLEIDHPLTFDEIDDYLVRQIHLMAPFGPGNPRPVFMTRGVEIADFRIMKEEHLKWTFRQEQRTLEGLAFFGAHRWGGMDGGRVDIAYQLEWNHWNGQRSIVLKIKDIKQA